MLTVANSNLRDELSEDADDEQDPVSDLEKFPSDVRILRSRISSFVLFLEFRTMSSNFSYRGNVPVALQRLPDIGNTDSKIVNRMMRSSMKLTGRA